MLVGTGDYHGFERLGAMGIIKMVKNAGTWTTTSVGNAQMAGTSVSQILFDPEDPRIVIATTGRGAGGSNGGGKVWRSINGGDTWTESIATLRPWNNVVCGAMNAATGRRIYYAVGNGTGSLLMRSFDKGKTWRSMTKPSTMSGASQRAIDIAASPVEPDTAYLMSGTDRRIWKTTDGGNRWVTKVSSSARAGFPFDDAAGDNYNFSQDYYDWFIACGTHTDDGSGEPMDDVYVGLITVARSSDGGETWKDEGYTYKGETVGPDTLHYTHNDQHCLTFVPGQGSEWDKMWVGNDGGIYKTSLNLATSKLDFDPSKNQRLHIAEFYHAAWDYQNSQPDTILGGTQDNGSPWSNASPPAWQTNLRLGDGVGAVIGRGAANGHQKQFTSRIADAKGFNFLSTRDWWVGEFGNPLSKAQPWATLAPLSGDPNNPNVVYSASNVLWKYDVSSAIKTTVTAGANSNTQTVA